MTCSARCSGNAARAALAAALLVLGCGHGAARVTGAVAGGRLPERPRVLVLPVDNMTGGAAPVKDLGARVARAVARRFEVLTGDQVERFLVRHRLRYTGGIDAAAARAARDELGADAVLITSLQSRRPAGPPALGLAMRLVLTGDEPTILWMDQASRSGDEAPGLLGLGLISTLGPIEEQLVGRLTASLEAAVDRGRQPERCGGGVWYRPRVRFRSPVLDRDDRPSLAVVPFFDRSGRRGAGDAVALEVVRQLTATGRFRVLEPGVVRDFLLRSRVIMPGGVSLETTRLLLGGMGVDLVASGTVYDYADHGGPKGPTVRFTMMLLEGGSGEVVWHSTSANRGDDGVFAFGLGRIATAGALTCRMVGGVVDQLARGKGDAAPLDWSRDPVRDAIQRRSPETAPPAEARPAAPADPATHEGP